MTGVQTCALPILGLEKIEFGWYLRKITLLALAGYFAGMLVIFLEHLLLG